MKTPQLRSVKNYRQFLEELAAQVENPAAGFFGPGSMAWRLNREVVLGLVVLRALLMQVAHPKVAQAIADHSDFRHRPFKRAYATLKAQQQIVFGTCEQAIETLVGIYTRHLAVRGEEKGLPDPAYDANDSHLSFWVYATLIDSMFYAYRTFLPDLSAEEWERFYDEGKFFASLMGIPPEILPATKEEFEAWMQRTLRSNEISVIPLARQIAISLMSTPFRITSPLTAFLAAGTLPPSLRQQFRLHWSPASQRRFDRLAAILRTLLAHTPQILHTAPAYWLALLRTRRAT